MAKQKSDTPKAPKCPITKEQFLSKAQLSLPVTIDTQLKAAMRKEFSTGSFGWHVNDKIIIMIDGVACKAQANLSIVLIGSKEQV